MQADKEAQISASLANLRIPYELFDLENPGLIAKVAAFTAGETRSSLSGRCRMQQCCTYAIHATP